MQPNQQGQAMYERAGRQAMQALTSDEGAEMIAQDAKARGPAQAIVSALQQVEAAIVKSAEGAGVQLPPDVLEATRDTMAKVLIAVMVESGLAEDPDALMAEVEPMLEGEAPGHEPTDPAMDEAEDAAEGEMEDDEDEPEDDDEDDEAPTGSLAQMRRGR